MQVYQVRNIYIFLGEVNLPDWIQIIVIFFVQKILAMLLNKIYNYLLLNFAYTHKHTYRHTPLMFTCMLLQHTLSSSSYTEVWILSHWSHFIISFPHSDSTQCVYYLYIDWGIYSYQTCFHTIQKTLWQRDLPSPTTYTHLSLASTSVAA